MTTTPDLMTMKITTTRLFTERVQALNFDPNVITDALIKPERIVAVPDRPGQFQVIGFGLSIIGAVTAAADTFVLVTIAKNNPPSKKKKASSLDVINGRNFAFGGRGR